MAARGVAVRKKVLNAADNRFRIQNSMAGNMFPHSPSSVQSKLSTLRGKSYGIFSRGNMSDNIELRNCTKYKYF